MISRYEASRVINDSLKQKIKKLHPYSQCFNLDPGLDIYTAMHDLATVAKNAVKTQDLMLYKQCIQVAEKLYSEGEHLVQDIVENVFIYEISSKVSKPMLPKKFYDVYMKQVMS
jgi:hypothetical protein